ncbi:MAG: endonuclease III [archaeon]
MSEKISKIMDKLSEYYNYTERTTLNRMRKKPDAFKILISCLLSLRTKDQTTESVSDKLFNVASTPEEIIKIPVDKLEKIIFSSGHYKKKARTLQSVSHEVLDRFGGKVPDDKEKLLSIKGVGPKTANIVLCFAYNQTVIPVDVNVHRVANRLGWVETKLAEKTEKELEKILLKKYWKEINGVFILHGKTICVPISPKCSICPVREDCPRVGVTRTR